MLKTLWFILPMLVIGGCATTGTHSTSRLTAKKLPQAQPDVCSFHDSSEHERRLEESILRGMKESKEAAPSYSPLPITRSEIMLEELKKYRRESNLWKAERVKMGNVILLELSVSHYTALRLLGELPLCDEKCMEVELSDVLPMLGL